MSSRARPDQIDLFVTDLTMPNMNGMELAGEILELRPDFPIVLTTGFGGTKAVNLVELWFVEAHEGVQKMDTRII